MLKLCLIVSKLSAMLDDYNVQAKAFRMAKEKLKIEPVHDLKLVLISNKNKDGRIYNIPSIYEVAALIVGDVDTGSKRDNMSCCGMWIVKNII